MLELIYEFIKVAGYQHNIKKPNQVYFHTLGKKNTTQSKKTILLIAALRGIKYSGINLTKGV